MSSEICCQSKDCPNEVTHAWFWPGALAPEDPIKISCFPCALRIAVILDALGIKMQCLDLDSVLAQRLVKGELGSKTIILPRVPA